MQLVTARTDWFEAARKVPVPVGATLADILDHCGIPTDLQPFYDIAINGEVIEPEKRRRIRPKVGRHERPIVITVHPPRLHGGNRGTAKNVATIVASLALVAGTAFIGIGGLGLVAGIGAIGPGVDGAKLEPGSFGSLGEAALRRIPKP